MTNAWFADLQLIKGLDDYVRACTMFSDQHLMRHAHFLRLQGAGTRPRLHTLETETEILKNSTSRQDMS